MVVNCKTYPAVSKKYTETVCTGGVTRDGQFVRLYPVPFRFLDPDQRYARWNLIRVKTYRDTKDQRPESRHLERGTPIEVIDALKTDKRKWEWMEPVIFESRAEMAAGGLTNGCVPIEPLEFYWKSDEKKWSANQLAVFAQGDLYADPAAKAEIAERVPYQFRLRFRETATGEEVDRKVLAWSYYQGYLRFSRERGEEAGLKEVAAKVERSLFGSDRAVFAIFGTHSRFPNRWMISGLYHPPKAVAAQRGLL